MPDVNVRAASGATKTFAIPPAVVTDPAPPPPPDGGTAVNRPANPALICYQSTSGSVAAWAKPGALIVAGRTNYGDAAFKTAAAGGATVLIYLDTLISMSTGRYHDKLINSSEFGPAVGGWPSPANSWGSLNNFRVGSTLQSKLPKVIDLIVAENPHIAGIFLDDLGTRPWFGSLPWDSWSTSDKEAYRAGAIAIAQTARAKADQHNLFVMVNGRWEASSSSAGSGGYPSRSVHGCSLVDGGMLEHPGAISAFYTAYASGPQWGTATPRKKGYIWVTDEAGSSAWRDSWVNANLVAFASTGSYGGGFPTPWRSFTDFHMPSRA